MSETRSEPIVIVDDPAPMVRRITLNRPEKRNALNHALRGALLDALRAGDQDDDVRVQIVRGAGPSFSAGYELGDGNVGLDMPFYTPRGDGQWPRHVTETWMSIWDLATGCDLVYVAEDAKMGYPAVRFGVPDMHFHAWFMGMRTAMEMMVTGDSISGIEAARLGWANRAFPADELEAGVLEVAGRIAKIEPDLVQINKRLVHRQMEVMGMRDGIRLGTELCALGTHQRSMHRFIANVREKGLTGALSERDAPFGDYRTS